MFVNLTKLQKEERFHRESLRTFCDEISHNFRIHFENAFSSVICFTEENLLVLLEEVAQGLDWRVCIVLAVFSGEESEREEEI